MSDPKLLSRSSNNEVERLLLRAARQPAPQSVKHGTWLAASAALAATTASTSAAAAGGAAAGHAMTAAKTGSLLSLKWIGIVSVVGIGAMAGAVTVQERTREAPSAPLAAPTSGTRADAVRAAESRTTAPVASATNVPAPDSTPAVPPSAIAAPVESVPTDTSPRHAPRTLGSAQTSTSAELAALDGARSALVAHDPASALALLDRYVVDFPHGSLAPEGTMLRIEALVAASDVNAARRVAASFLRDGASVPYAKRIRSLLESDGGGE